ncbi:MULTISPECIES: PAS domain S-box protein [unclassified Leeuwenhoekiella]|uniref:PAS domain S-box protein n=1 Tax=unclassified Leeuwenhoekiella TaxID=2615029 RepID=UPI000C5B32A2|nr:MULTISPECIES: PAS domain S-box protein [unclassified Leeuwenhoekiella]MAW94311.1 hypothetical protein [Leeuwenhoekiella sp.]MBA82992.1 hypothetical protein [Leeuwenhoekiella sp.]|tara:strand:+ start:11868 stop:14078 length:2211 start_codon:yes stop_codon:yes gene_type:complete
MNEQRYAHILKGTAIGLWEWNILTKEVIFSEEWAKVLGYTPDEISHTENLWEALCHPEDYEKSQHLLESHLSGESSFYESEVRMRHKDGRYIWVKDQGKVVSWKDGKPEWMTGFHKETTQAKIDAEIKRTFIDQAPGAIAMFDTELNYLAASKQWIIDYNLPEDIEGQNHYDLFDIPERWKEIHRRCLAGEIHQAEEDEFFDRTGNPFYLRWQVKPWYRGDKIGGLLMQTSNLTTFKKLQIERLRQSRFQETVFNAIDVGIVACNEKKELTYFNKTSREWHGLPSEPVPASQLSEYYSLYQADAKTLLAEKDIPLLKVLEGQQLNEDEIIVIKIKDKDRFVRVTGNQLFDEKDRMIGAVVAMHDITEIIKSTKEKNLSDTTFKSSFENAPIGMALVSPEGDWIQINQQVSEILGYTEEDFRSFSLKDIIYPDDLEIDSVFLNQLLQGKKDNYQIEKRYFHKNGGIVHAILSVSVVRGDQNAPLFLIKQITDITNQRKYETDLHKALELTKNQNERLMNFSHIVSHNLRSHSGNLSMLVNFLKEELKGDQAELVEMLGSASAQLTETIEHLTEVTELQRNEDEVLKPVRLKEYLKFTENTLKAIIKENNIRFIDDTDSDILIHAIPAYLESILLNFTTNAIKYRSVDTDSYVKFETQKLKNEIILSISDNGLGIDLNKHGEKLFGMYNTFHEHADSRGIGLFITKNQIEAMGAEVRVASKVGKGTTFEIRFPYEEKI